MSHLDPKRSNMLQLLTLEDLKHKSGCFPLEHLNSINITLSMRGPYNCSIFNQGSRESLRGPGQNICSDCINRVFDCSIRVYRSFGAHKQSGAHGKMPQLPPPPLGGPVFNECMFDSILL